MKAHKVSFVGLKKSMHIEFSKVTLKYWEVDMIEAPSNARTRDAIRAAHQARSDALKEIWRWFRKPHSSE
ncbi:hypothetical protein [Roseovarius aestuarii]|uniref:hypothetical protein n=2 Tax=Roseovarius aestuarii TaxID=475083 RepID=UPI00111C6692